MALCNIELREKKKKIDRYELAPNILTQSWLRIAKENAWIILLH